MKETVITDRSGYYADEFIPRERLEEDVPNSGSKGQGVMGRFLRWLFTVTVGRLFAGFGKGQ